MKKNLLTKTPANPDFHVRADALYFETVIGIIYFAEKKGHDNRRILEKIH